MPAGPPSQSGSGKVALISFIALSFGLCSGRAFRNRSAVFLRLRHLCDLKEPEPVRPAESRFRPLVDTRENRVTSGADAVGLWFDGSRLSRYT